MESGVSDGPVRSTSGGPPANHETSQDLHHRFLGAAAWMAASRAALGIASIGVTFVMARLLQPQDYGLMAMAQVITGLLAQAQSLGVGQALVQRDHVTAENEQTAFTLALVSSLALYAIVCVVARPVAIAYGDERVAPLLWVIGLTFPLGAFTIVPGALLRRDLKMRGDAVTSVWSLIAESAVMLVLAWRGQGVWALAAGQLTAVVTTALGLSLYRPWSVGLRFRGGDLRAIVRFGGGATLSSFLWYAYQNADFFIVGRALGPAALGAYSMAWKLAKMPWERLFRAVTPVLLPLYSRARGEPGELAAALGRLSRFTALVTIPAVAGLGAIAEDVVHVFLGEKWRDVAAPLVWLSVYMSLRSLFSLMPQLLMAAGRIRQEIAFNVLCVLVLPAAFAASVSWGPEGVAAAWALIWPSLALVWLVPRTLAAADMSHRRYLKAVVRPLAATVAMVLAVWAIGQVMPSPTPVRLGLRLGAGVAVYLAAIRLLEGSLVAEFKEVMRGVRQGMKH
jgi:O-antigen/teichoic acid export membrane protein